MALLSTITCKTCAQRREVWHSPGDGPPDICGDCHAARQQAERDAALIELAAMPTDERLRRIEAWIYDHKQKYHAPIPARF